MRDMSDGAREILVITQELARSRGAHECSATDLTIAAVIYRRLVQERVADGEDGPQETTSPAQLPMGATLERCLTRHSSATLHVSELLDLATAENPDLSGYLR